jgi:hypothetical protein
MSAADKALALAGRYARLRLRQTQCRRTTGRLFDACEKPLYHGDESAGSGCIAALCSAKADGDLRYDPDGESNWHQLLKDLEFCRPCLVGLAVSRHRKRRLGRRVASVLASLCRLGRKV